MLETMSPCDDLVGFADGELEPDRAAAFRAHLRTCEACRPGLVEAMHLNARASEPAARLVVAKSLIVAPRGADQARIYSRSCQLDLEVHGTVAQEARVRAQSPL